MKKIQDAKVISYKTVEGQEVPVIQPEVYQRIYCKSCENEVDSEEEATGVCSDCGEPWEVHKAKDIQVKVIQIPLGSGTGE
jgi:Zn finger protein HypA/HybF involved in hydrogenase expression